MRKSAGQVTRWSAGLVFAALASSGVATTDAAAESDPGAPTASAFGQVIEPDHGAFPFVFGAEQEPHWLGRLLARLKARRGAGTRLTAHLLFHDAASAPTYLALIWKRPSGEFFEVHRVRPGPGDGVRLTLLRDGDRLGEYDGVFFEQPTGFDLAGDGVPYLLVLLNEGGSMPQNYSIQLIRMKGATRDITPSGWGLPQNLFESGSPIHPVLVTNAYNVAGYPLATVWNLTAKRFEPACRANADLYANWHQRMGEDAAWVTTHLEGGYANERALRDRVADVLDLLQSGRFDEARGQLDAAIRAAESGPDAGNWPKYAVQDIPPLIEAAKRHAAEPCPLSAALGPGTVHGAEGSAAMEEKAADYAAHATFSFFRSVDTGGVLDVLKHRFGIRELLQRKRAAMFVLARLLELGLRPGERTAGGGVAYWPETDPKAILARVEREWVDERRGLTPVDNVRWYAPAN